MKIKFKKYWRKTSFKNSEDGLFFLNHIKKIKPKNFLEIGVFHGVTSKNVCELLYSLHGNDFKFTGIDLFSTNTEESKDISGKLIANEFSKVQTIFFEQTGKALQSIEDYILPDDYLYAVNQTYAVKLRKEGFVNLTQEDIESRKKTGIIESLNSIWEEHKEDGWENFESEEVCRYICEKIAINEADFMSDKTKDRFRSLYRLIAERIRQQQNLISNQNMDAKKKMRV